MGTIIRDLRTSAPIPQIAGFTLYRCADACIGVRPRVADEQTP